MRASSMMRWMGVAILGTITSVMAACGSEGAGSAGTGNTGCTPGAQQACACPGGTQGAQVCSDDGRSFGACDCGGGMTTGATTGAGGTLITTTGTQMGTCGDGIMQPGECNQGSEFYCAADCGGMGGAGGGTTTSTTSTTGAGGACNGVVIYAGKVDGVGSVWATGHGSPKVPPPGGKTGVAAGDAMCNQMANGSHACTYDEMVSAKGEPGFKAIAAGTKAWVHRTTDVMVGGQNYPAGKGARCDDWLYATDHLNDGEWADFQAQGVPTYHLDMIPATIQAAPKDAPCGANNLDRSLLCCYPCP